MLLVELQKNYSQSSVISKISVVLPLASGTLFSNEAEKNPAHQGKAVKNEESINSWLFETTTEIPHWLIKTIALILSLQRYSSSIKLWQTR